MADYSKGRQHFEESFCLFRSLEHQWGMAWALNTWGSMSKFMGELRDASERFKEGLTIYRELGYQPGLADSLSQLAQIAYLQGRFAEGERLARESVATAREAGSRTELAYALLSQGEALERVGKFEEAHAVFQQSLALYNELGHLYYVTEAQSSLGSVDMHRGCYEEARDRLQTSLALARSQGPPYCVGLNLLLLGCLEQAVGAHAMTQQFLQDSIAAYQEVGGHRDDLSWALATLAIAAHSLGDTPGARQHLRHALELALESGMVPPLLWALPAMALLLASGGQIERAVELYALASRYPFVANSRWFEDVAGNQIAAQAATLPETAVTAAKERGLERDLHATVAELLAELRD
jgi:tetratricopeptide (TPR) repeat protein